MITATPANGYYVADAQVIAGTATYSINGNVITVNPSSDCTIQVNFAAKTSVTVTYVSSGAVVGTKTVYVQESVTLPSSVNNTPSGWTFIGWTENQVEQTQNKPTYYAPGASYTVPRNITLYALYKKGQATGSVKAYELVTSAPSNWTGNYVITSGTDSNMLILKGLSGTTAHQNSSGASSLSASGATLNGTRLENVNDLYVFRISASGSSWYSSGYTLQNKSTGTYLYADSTNGFYSVEVQYSSGMTWGLAYSNGCMRISNSAVYSYPYLARIYDYDYFGMVNTYATDYPTQLWRETEGTGEVEIYWTNPNAHTHSLQYVAAVAATCTNAGHSAYYYCSGCNKYFSDSNAQNEITLASTNIPALGHNFGAWTVTTAATCTKAGVETRYCSRCNATETRNVAALGHNAGTPVIENRVEPTATTDGGYDTVTYCQRCNAELSREHTTLDMLKYFVKNSLSLAGDIGVNFYVNLREISPENAKVVFTWYNGDEEKTKTYDDFNGLTVNSEGNYKLSVQVSAKQMTEVIHADLYNGTEKVSEKDYTVAEYGRTVLSMTVEQVSELGKISLEKAAKLREMCKAMLIYGAKAQLQFGYRTDDLADADLEYTLEDVGELVTKEFPEGFEEACGIRYDSSSLLLRSETIYRLYFIVTDQTKLQNLNVTNGQQQLTCSNPNAENGTKIYFDITNIHAKKVLTDFNLTFGDVPVTVNVGTYMTKALEQGSDSLKQVMKALYWYSMAAKAYF